LEGEFQAVTSRQLLVAAGDDAATQSRNDAPQTLLHGISISAADVKRHRRAAGSRGSYQQPESSFLGDHADSTTRSTDSNAASIRTPEPSPRASLMPRAPVSWRCEWPVESRTGRRPVLAKDEDS